MPRRCGVLNIDDVKPFVALFDKMDRDGSGKLTPEDLDVAGAEAEQAEAERKRTDAERRMGSMYDSKHRGTVAKLDKITKVAFNPMLKDSQYNQAKEMASRLPSPAQQLAAATQSAAALEKAAQAAAEQAAVVPATAAPAAADGVAAVPPMGTQGSTRHISPLI